MKAAIVESPGVLTVREVPDPQIGDYQVLCRMLYGATCTGTDQHIIHNRFPWGVKYPTILGHESVGQVIQLGPKVRYLKEGDVITRVGAPAAADGSVHSQWGGFAELGVATDHRAMVADERPQTEWQGTTVNQVIPSDMDPRAATMIITWRETLSFVTRLGVKEGAKVLVIGSGGNGLAFVAHARNLGASAVGVLGSGARKDLFERAGTTAYADYKGEDPVGKLRAGAPGGYDFLIDAVGKNHGADPLLGCLRPGGVFTTYGIDEFHGYGINPRLGPNPWSWAFPGYDEAEAHTRVVEFMQQGKLDAGLWLDLDKPFDLADINQAFDAVHNRTLMKALVKLS